MDLPVFPRQKKPPVKTPTGFEIYWTRRRMWIAVTWSVLVFCLGGAYYLFIYLPAAEKHQVELKKQEIETQERIEKAKLEQENERQLRLEKAEQDYRSKALDQKNTDRYLLETCLQDSEQRYVALWDHECDLRNLPPDCRLPAGPSDDLNKYLKDLKDECFKRFPQGDNGSVPTDSI